MEMTPQNPQERFVLQSHQSTYDFTQHRRTLKPTNIVESIGHLVKGCLGGGVMGVHEAYKKSGIWVSLVFTILFGLYITYCVHMVVKSAQTLYRKLHITEMSYPDVAEASMVVAPFPSLKRHSRHFRYAVDFIICVDLFGSCCVYEVIIAKSMAEILKKDKEDKNIVRMYILYILVPILLLCMIRSLKYLAPFTLIADFFIVLCVGTTVYYGCKSEHPLSSVPAVKDWMGFFEFCGIIVFSMEGVGVSMPIENNMKNPRQFPVVLCGGMFIVVSFVTMVGFFGYWAFLEEASSPVTLNFKEGTFPQVLKILMTIMIYVTFALNFWAPFNLCWYYLAKRHPEEKHWFWERVYRTIIIILITIVAVAFPNITNLMGLIGAFCLSNMGFIFPALIETLVIWEDPGLGKFNWMLHKNIAISLLGIALLISSSYSNGKALFADVFK